MRDKVYLSAFFLGAGLLLYTGRGLLTKSTVVTLGLTFAGTTSAAVLGVALYRVQLELRASRHELARKEAELNFALEVQRALFPERFPLDGGLEFSAICVPASVISGDYYEVLQPGDGRLVFAVADISGKGVSAAILMSNVHAVLRTLAEAGQPPRDLCDQLNRHLYKVTDDSRFATFFYAEWNRAQRCLCYVNAGHPAPMLRNSRRALRLERGGLPLGMFPDSEYEVGQVLVEPGDLIVLYSDGITEAGVHRDEPFGESRLEDIIATHHTQPLAEIQQEVLTAVRRWSGKEPEDDMTLLLVRAKGLA